MGSCGIGDKTLPVEPAYTESAAVRMKTIEAEPTLTYLLRQWSEGDRRAAEAVFDRVYDELRRLARGQFLREQPGHVLQPTALVHEVVLRLLDEKGIEWESRSHFFGIAATLMRRILVDVSRERNALKRGGDRQRIPLDDALRQALPPKLDLLDLDQALEELEEVDPRKALLVEMRFFGGLTVDEAADCLGLSPRTTAREWRKARAFLYRQLHPGSADGR